MTQVTALKPIVNVRRGINLAAGILGNIKDGDTLVMLGDLIPGASGGETWARVVWPKDRTTTAYVCVTLPGGAEMCRVEGMPDVPDEHTRGYNEALDDMHAALVKLRK